MNRTTVKQDLRRITEVGIVAVLGRVPRVNRRAAGRRIANAAYRKLNSLPVVDFKATKSLVDWTAKSYGEYQAQLQNISNQVDRGNAPTDGSATSAVADKRDDGEGTQESLDGSGVGEVAGE